MAELRIAADISETQMCRYTDVQRSLIGMTGRQVAESVEEAGVQITLICTLRTVAARRRDSRVPGELFACSFAIFLAFGDAPVAGWFRLTRSWSRPIGCGRPGFRCPVSWRLAETRPGRQALSAERGQRQAGLASRPAPGNFLLAWIKIINPTG